MFSNARGFDFRFQYLLKKREGKALSLFKQMTGIEPALSAWEAEVLPLNHICVSDYIISHPERFFNTYEKIIYSDPTKKKAPAHCAGAGVYLYILSFSIAARTSSRVTGSSAPNTVSLLGSIRHVVYAITIYGSSDTSEKPG